MTEMPLVLDASIEADYATWVRLWETWESREVWAHPGYGRLFASSEDKVVCAALYTGDGGILLPMIMRPLSAEYWAADRESRWDVSSPYGYGGAFAWGADTRRQSRFWPWVDEWLRSHRVVSCFYRLALFEEQLLPGIAGRCYQRDNVVRSTKEPPDLIWRDYAPKVRKNVTRARASGLTCSIDPSGAGLDSFLEIYHATMRRRGASQFYFFDRPFFERLVQGLPGQFVFFHVFKGTDLLASELALVSQDRVYSFLGGTDERYFDLRPNDFLKHSVIEWTHQTGRSAFVLGGGAAPDDGILRYKQSFAPRGLLPFYTSSKILDQAGCDELIRQRTTAEARRGRTWTPAEGFFPPYRG
jgi:hypothetical protein